MKCLYQTEPDSQQRVQSLFLLCVADIPLAYIGHIPLQGAPIYGNITPNRWLEMVGQWFSASLLRKHFDYKEHAKWCVPSKTAMS